MRFAKDPLLIENSRLNINNINLYSPKNDELNVNGTVDFADMDHIMTNIRLRAQNYQIIDAKENKQSVAYGKAEVSQAKRSSVGRVSRISLTVPVSFVPSAAFQSTLPLEV